MYQISHIISLPECLANTNLFIQRDNIVHTDYFKNEILQLGI